jgi:hypothetical protein
LGNPGATETEIASLEFHERGGRGGLADAPGVAVAGTLISRGHEGVCAAA